MLKRFTKRLIEDKNCSRTKVKTVKMENNVPKNADKKTNITRIKSQVLRNVKSENKFESAAEEGENEHNESSKFGEEVCVHESDEEYAVEVEEFNNWYDVAHLLLKL